MVSRTLNFIDAMNVGKIVSSHFSIEEMKSMSALEFSMELGKRLNPLDYATVVKSITGQNMEMLLELRGMALVNEITTNIIKYNIVFLCEYYIRSFSNATTG